MVKGWKPDSESMEHPSYRYAVMVVTREVPAPKYVIKQCEFFLDDWEGRTKWEIDMGLLRKIYLITKTMKMGKGPRRGESIYDSLAGFQWLLVTASLCTVYRDNPKKRRYERIVLEIARKNGKTFLVALIFLLLFFMEPPYSRLFSVAPTGALAREIKMALEPLIDVNRPYLQDKEFVVRRDDILHAPNQNLYVPLNFSDDKLDGREPNVFVVDEVGVLPTSYAIDSMRSGQLMVQNPLGFIISTKYPTSQNPFEDEVELSKKILNGVVNRDDSFSLLYEPDDTTGWATNDMILKHANPLALEIESVWDKLIAMREEAIGVESKRENFITKHCNIIYQGVGTEAYVSIDQIQACTVPTGSIDWRGKSVYIGVDLAQTNDNCAVVMVGMDDSDGEEKIIALPMAFIPKGRMVEKSRIERVSYQEFCQKGICIACGDMIVDYSVIEQYVLDLPQRYGVVIEGIGFDKYNCISSAQKWENANLETTEVRQHSDTLHMPTKLLKEKIEERKFAFETNRLYEINFENCRCVYDSGLRAYVSKKKSPGKVDEVVATINAVLLLQQNALFGDDGFVVQTL